MTPSAALLIVLAAASTIALSSALSDEQLALFVTSDNVETNTGQTGSVTIVTNDGVHTITSNGVPDHATPEYPNQGNPNDIETQSFRWTIPVNPSIADSTTELPLGPVGVAVNGIPFFNPYTITGEDAVLTEIFDSCDGHPDPMGVYHYHRQPSSCVFEIVAGQPSPMIGVALDGFPIYGPIDEDGNTLTSADLDECHGRFVNGAYQYHTTADFPYILGCFKGEVTVSDRPDGPPPRPQPTTGDPAGDGAGSVRGAAALVCSLAVIAAILQSLYRTD